MEQNRWKSPVVILSLSALVFFIAKTWFGYEIPGWDKFIELVIGAGLAIGILNNPTDSQGW